MLANSRQNFAALLFVLIFAGQTQVAHAQTPPLPQNLPGSVDPGRIEERLANPVPETTVEKGDEAPSVTAPSLPDIKNGFILKAVDFEGNEALSNDDLTKLLQNYIGKQIDADFASELASYVTRVYRKRGYFLSKAFVDTVDPDNGHVAIRVVEGYIEHIEIKNSGVDLGKDRQHIVENTLDKIKSMRPLNGPKLERYLLLLNDLYGINVETTLVPLVDMPNPPVGAVGMIASLSPRERLSSAEINNYGSVFTGPNQSIYTLNVGTPIDAFDNLKLQFFNAFPLKEMRYIQAEYSLPIGTEGLLASVSATKSFFEPGDNLKIFDLKSRAESLAFSLQYPLIRSRAKNLTLDGSFEARNSQTNVLGTEFFDDRLRILRGGLSYQFYDRTNAQNMVSAHLSQGLDILGSRETGSLNLSRAGGHSDFTKLEWSASRSQPLPHDFGLETGFAGQYAFSQLLSSEEFGYGGQYMGRAYDSSEIVGDHGVSAFVEARYSGLPEIKDLHLMLQPYAFYDIGKVWNIEDGSKPESGASAGGGIRLFLGSNITGNFSVAVPLTRDVANPSHGNGTNPRYYFQLTTTF